MPPRHVCSNTLELPDYAEALIATQRNLQAEWSAAVCSADSTHNPGPNAAGMQASQSAEPAGNSSCPQLTQACCKVLEDRLLVSWVRQCFWWRSATGSTVLLLGHEPAKPGCQRAEACKLQQARAGFARSNVETSSPMWPACVACTAGWS